MDLDQDEGAETCLTTTRKARKPHKCDTCTVDIQPGQPYNHHYFPYNQATYLTHADQAICFTVMNEAR
jgi:hypothetical protein